MYKNILLIFFGLFCCSFTSSLKVKTTPVYNQIDSLTIVSLVKKNAHASYYSDKLNGRKTASGQVFSNSKYTAAHKTLKFGTKLKVTNTVNGKWVVVTVNDRGPFTNGRDIDLTKKAFMEIVKYKHKGALLVTIEIVK